MGSEHLIHMKTLIHYGWSSFQAEQYDPNSKKDLLPGRVITIKGFKYLLITEKGELETELSGKLLYATAPEDLPKVGDWVLYLHYDTTGYIIEVLPRINALIRKDPATQTGKQVLACNVDGALIVQGLDREFNLMRLDRYIVQITACGITPVVILSKADLVGNPEDFVSRVVGLKRDCPIHLCSSQTGSGVAEIKSHVLEKNKTFILVGSSGVGKSSLLNNLLNEVVQRTEQVSDFNKKGKHTTSSRELFRLDNGSLIIDSPGMREFGLTSSEPDNSAELFPPIATFSEHCRFTDCNHLNTAGCAVIDAVSRGALDQTIYDSYVKLMKERRHFDMSTAEKNRLGKQMGKMIRGVKDYKKRFKGG